MTVLFSMREKNFPVWLFILFLSPGDCMSLVSISAMFL